jgi:hypothetical protein
MGMIRAGMLDALFNGKILIPKLGVPNFSNT